jgi:outer membrane receptor protein involved in Fe transport
MADEENTGMPVISRLIRGPHKGATPVTRREKQNPKIIPDFSSETHFPIKAYEKRQPMRPKVRLIGGNYNMRKYAPAVALLILGLTALGLQSANALARNGRGAEGEGTQGRANDLTVRLADAPAQPITFNIKAQPLEDALNEFARQTGYQVLFQSGMVEKQTAPPLNATLTPDAALRTLLSNTGLHYKFVNPRTVTISTTEQAVTTAVGPQETSLRITQNTGNTGEARNKGSQSEPSEAPAGAKESLEEVLITGSHIRGIQDLPVSSRVITRTDIERTGFSSTEQLLESLPQNFGGLSFDGSMATGASQIAAQNGEGVASVDLRGLGPQSTLVLVNGKRRAGSMGGRVVDISGIPLSAIDRVEVITGGRSAIYGSDAVGGVVNFITRRNFDGVEGEVYFGSRDQRGGAETRLSLVTGQSSDKGGFVFSYDYARAHPLDLIDTDQVVSPSIDGTIPRSINLSSDERRHSFVLAGQVEISPRSEFYADILYSSAHDDFEQRYTAAFGEFDDSNENSKTQYGASLGLRVDLDHAWQLDVSGSHSLASLHNSRIQLVNGEGEPTVLKPDNTIYSLSLVADGPLFEFNGSEVRAAVGVEGRKETNDLGDGDPDNRTIRSVFAEMTFPLSGTDPRTGLQRLELSMAGRYDDYSDFGGNFEPQVGLIYRPAAGLALRSTYATAFRAPDLFSLASSSFLILWPRSDPLAASGSSPLLQRQGGNSEVEPEEADTWSFGFDYVPGFAPRAKVALSYFDIKYENRVDVPISAFSDLSFVLDREALYAALIERNPNPSDLGVIIDTSTTLINITGTAFDPQTQNILDVFPSLVVFDNRQNNIAIEKVRGLDVAFDASLDTRMGTSTFGIDATYALDHDRKVTATSPAFGQLNEVGKPVDFRARANAALSRGAYGAFLYVNYTDGYRNPFTTPVSRIGSWTTVDLTLNFNSVKTANLGPMSNIRASFSIDNIFDRSPPQFRQNNLGLGYDAANANAVGRFFSLRLAKRW